MRETDWTELVELRFASAARQHVIARLAFGKKRERIKRLSLPPVLPLVVVSSHLLCLIFRPSRHFLIPPRVQVGPHRQHQQSLTKTHQRLLMRRCQRNVQFSSRRPGSNKWVSLCPALPYIFHQSWHVILKRKAPNYKTHRWRDPCCRNPRRSACFRRCDAPHQDE